MTKLETFVASLPTKRTSELIYLMIDRDSLYVKVANDASGFDDASQRVRAACAAIATEIDLRVLPRGSM